MSILRDRLGNQWWRLNNLYWIVDEDGREMPFRPNEVQERLWRERAWRNLILKARQKGITTFVQILALDECVFRKNHSAQVIAHTIPDATKIFRDKVKFGYLRLPPEILRKVPAVKNESGELLLANGSGMRVTTSARSGTVQFLHVSELGKIAARQPEKAREIITGSLPAAHPGNYVFVEATAEGRSGHFYDLQKQSRDRTMLGGALGELDFRFHFFPWWQGKGNRVETPEAIPDRLADYFGALEGREGIRLDDGQKWWYVATERTLGADMLREHPSDPDEAFRQTVEGAYYERELQAVYRDGRVRDVGLNERYPVHTFWDIGEDCTAIWFGQVVAGGWVVFLKYLDFAGEGLDYYVQRLRETKYPFGRHILPPDIKNREWGTGRTRIEIAHSEHGLVMEEAPRIGLEDGIQAVRQLLKRAIFSETGCEVGLSRLAGYRRKWNAAMGTWLSVPQHDINSHGADAFRMAAVSDVTGDAPGADPWGGVARELIDRGAK